MENPLLTGKWRELDEKLKSDPAYDNDVQRCIVPFVACGDLDGLDPDKNYPLNVDIDWSKVNPLILKNENGKIKAEYKYEYHSPVQPPTDPCYKKVLDDKKAKNN